MKRTLIKNAILVNEGTQTQGSVVIEGEKIAEILTEKQEPEIPCQETIDATGCYLLPGVIDEHVHFREPGLTQKADISSESRAAAAGGVTSVMDMPNTNPQTTTLEALEQKRELFAEKSLVNYSCYLGATKDNYKILGKADEHRTCGIKLFMGSSTGNMLVDDMKSLQRIFHGTDLIIAAHCEDTQQITEQKQITLTLAQALSVDNIAPDDLNLKCHTIIRPSEACYKSTQLAVKLAQEADARLHVMHISTKEELQLFKRGMLKHKKVTAEVCLPHLLFDYDDYDIFKSKIKCNPSLKGAKDQHALRRAVNSGFIDTIATDHAPHLLSDKVGGALKAASGMPMIQFSLVAMLRMVDEGIFKIEKVVEKMCHAPAQLYQINNRGYIRQGYQADLVLVRPNDPWTLTTDLILSKCGWSPLEGKTFDWKVMKTFVNGFPVYNDGQIDDRNRGQELRFR